MSGSNLNDKCNKFIGTLAFYKLLSLKNDPIRHVKQTASADFEILSSTRLTWLFKEVHVHEWHARRERGKWTVSWPALSDTAERRNKRTSAHLADPVCRKPGFLPDRRVWTWDLAHEMRIYVCYLSIRRLCRSLTELCQGIPSMKYFCL